MPALTRRFKKIFAKDSTNNGVFGSAAALAPATSTNPETIESLAAFLTGWEDATEGGLRLPTLEDMQGLKYDTDYHLAYIYENGMQVYNSLTTYYEDNLVREDSTGKIWKSLIDNNVGNALVEGANWTLLGDLANIPASPIVDASTTAKGIIEIATDAEVAAGTDTARSIVPSALAALFGASVMSTVSDLHIPVKIGGSIVNAIMKTGITSNIPSATPTAVLFPAAFPTALFFAVAIGTVYTGAAESNNIVTSFAPSGFTLTTGSNTSQPYRWFAMGY